MPVIRRGDADRVNILAFQKLADVATRRNLFALFLELLRSLVQNELVHVAQRGKAYTLQVAVPINVTAAPPSKANHCHANLVTGTDLLRDGRKRDVHRCGGSQGGL